MAVLIEGETADDIWQRAAALFIPDSVVGVPREAHGAAADPHAPGAHVQDGRGGETREVLRALLTLHDPLQRWIVSREPALNPAFGIAEVVWILAGRRDAAFVNAWNPTLPQFAGHGMTYTGAYGHRLRTHFGLDQLARAADVLARNPESRQVVLQLWDPARDLPDATGTPSHPDVPCNVSAFLKVRAGRLEWTQVMRSNDLVLGLPHNVVQFTTLQEVVAGWLGLEPGEYGHLSDSLHVYRRDLAAVAASLTAAAARAPAPHNPDVLALPRADADRVWESLARRLDEISRPACTVDAVAAAVGVADAPVAHENLVRVAAADIARRRGWPELATWCMDGCTSAVLHQLWTRWAMRRGDHLQEPRVGARL